MCIRDSVVATVEELKARLAAEISQDVYKRQVLSAHTGCMLRVSIFCTEREKVLRFVAVMESKIGLFSGAGPFFRSGFSTCTNR